MIATARLPIQGEMALKLINGHRHTEALTMDPASENNTSDSQQPSIGYPSVNGMAKPRISVSRSAAMVNSTATQRCLELRGVLPSCDSYRFNSGGWSLPTNIPRLPGLRRRFLAPLSHLETTTVQIPVCSGIVPWR